MSKIIYQAPEVKEIIFRTQNSMLVTSGSLGEGITEGTHDSTYDAWN